MYVTKVLVDCLNETITFTNPTTGEKSVDYDVYLWLADDWRNQLVALLGRRHHVVTFNDYPFDLTLVTEQLNGDTVNKWADMILANWSL